MHEFQPLSDIFIDLGFFQWQKYSLMILLGLAIAILLGIKEGKKLGISGETIIDGAIVIVPLSIAGTRLWYVAFEWSRFYVPGSVGDTLMKIINISEGGLAIHGGFLTALVSVIIYTHYKKINVFKVFDLMAPGFLIAQAFGRWGNFFNQEAHGGVIGGAGNLSLDEQRAFLSDTLHLPDYITNNMYLYGPDGLRYYHPTFLYESIWNVIGFIIILILRRTKLTRTGDMIGFYLIWYSVGRFFIEAMRTDSLYIGDTGLRTAQIISLIMIAAGVVFLVINRTIFKQPKYYEALAEIEEQNSNTIEENVL
ncbi:MAG: Prolipoprotein diacylglyceryl transferase [Candidatus Izimaplasma bacterium HR2]|nr:MAG: Prolipoprotein diacylglyceryl transferase [Candidatus Izimaplasma bacterium HR2]